MAALTAAQRAAAAAQAAATAQLQATLTALYAVRDSGQSRMVMKIAGIEREFEYRSDKELLAAINDLERRLGMSQLTSFVVHGRKGWNRRRGEW